ncbi:MAG: N-6 DNA methylase [Pseudomonadota bacterium]
MSRPAVQKFVKGLSRICSSKHADEVLRDFCELAYCALAKQASPWPEQQDELEAQYMDVVGRYRDKDHIRAMPEYMALALGEIGNGGIDFLGEVAGEFGALDGRMGQFFTPYPVSRLMAEMNLQGVEDLIEKNGFVTVQEPAAGAGGMLLALADVIEAQGFNLETQVWIEATELSRSTFHMCFIQCAARGLAGRIIHGNSLSLETFGLAFTAAAPMFFAENGDPFAKQKAEAAAKAKMAQEVESRAYEDRARRLEDMKTAQPIQGEQLSLF